LRNTSKIRRGCCKYKSFDPTFSKVGGFLGQRPESTSAELETPRTSEKVPLFASLHLLVNALLAKGEKEERNGLICERGCCISEFSP